MKFPPKILTILLFTCFLNQAYAQESKNKDSLSNTEVKQKDWRFTLSPYALLASMSADVGGEKIRQTFSDLTSITNMGFQIAGSVNYKRWYFHTNYTYANLKAVGSIGPITLDAEVLQHIWDNKLGYRVIDKIDEGDDVIRGWSMETTLGFIYWGNNVSVDIEYPLDIDLPNNIVTGQNWMDFVVGANFDIFFSKTVHLTVQGDIGGFGIGNSSKLYWDFFFANTFKVSKLLSVTAGYRSFQYDREDGSGEDLVKSKIKTYGPLIGVSFHL